MNRLPLPLLGILAAGLAACRGPDPAVVPASPLLGAAQTAPAAQPPAVPPNPGLPYRPGEIYTGPAAGQSLRDQAAVAAACRRDADRIVTLRDRGQLMREDERDSRLGTDSSIYASRAQTDRLGRIFERDRIAADCVQQNTRSAPQQ